MRRLIRFGIAAALLMTAALAAEAEEQKTDKRPQLVDLGAKACIPCSKMAPILEQLTKEYADSLAVTFIDVKCRDNAATVKSYGIRGIPTQVFIDPDGKELWRHEGFLAKADILAKWAALGYKLVPAPAPAAPEAGVVAKPATAACSKADNGTPCKGGDC